MVIKIGDIEIYEYDHNDKDQRHLKYVLNQDPGFLNFVTKKLDERLEESSISSQEGLQFFNSYLVKYKNEFVGYIRLEQNKRLEDTVEIQCAISPEFRNKKIGSILLETISSYILEYYEKINKIAGVIDRYNYASRSMAQKAGFIEEDRDDNYIYVSKSK